MKAILLLLLSLVTTLSLAHEGVTLGPNGGHVLELSKDESLHGEVTLKDKQLHITLLDKDLKPIAPGAESLTAVTGEREAPVKLEVTKDDKGFIVPEIKAGDWLILRFKKEPSATAITARLHYNTAVCEECKAQEWLCKCPPAKEEKQRKKNNLRHGSCVA